MSEILGQIASWPVAILVIVLVFRRDLVDLLRIVKLRLTHGGGLKIGAFELDSIRVPKANAKTVTNLKGISIDKDDVDDAESGRAKIYEENRGIMLVHALQRSDEPEQLYDIIVYVIPHVGAFINGVNSVSYFFGRKFGNCKFVSTDKKRNFAVAVSAYGPMMCQAEITFTDGHRALQHRYIDFEMGDGGEVHPHLVAGR